MNTQEMTLFSENYYSLFTTVNSYQELCFPILIKYKLSLSTLKLHEILNLLVI